MSGPLLEIDRLRLELPRRDGEPLVLLREVSLTIGEGEVVGLVGESGAGKSTVLRAILGLEPPGASIEGALRFRGRTVGMAGPVRREELRGRHVAMVFQEPAASLNPVLTIGEQVAEVVRAHPGTSPRAAARARAVELLELVGLPEPEQKAGRYPHQLSGGECQRAMLAMALAGEPALLLADEPTSALDPTVQARILELLRRCRDRLGLSVLLVSHDLGVIARICDRAAVLYAGEVMEEGPVEALLEKPEHPYTRALLRSTPRLGAPAPRGRIPVIPGRAPGSGERPAGCSFHPRCGERLPICDREHPALFRGSAGRPVRCFLVAPDRGDGA